MSVSKLDKLYKETEAIVESVTHIDFNFFKQRRFNYLDLEIARRNLILLLSKVRDVKESLLKNSKSLITLTKGQSIKHNVSSVKIAPFPSRFYLSSLIDPN